MIAAANDDCTSIDSRANDFDSVSSTVLKRPYEKYGCGDDMSSLNSSVSPPRRQMVKHTKVDQKTKKNTAKRPTNGRGDAFQHIWAVTDNALKFAPPIQTAVQKKQQILDIYKKCSDMLPTDSTPSGTLKSSSYINRKAKLKEAERINNIVLKKLLTVKSTVPKV